MWLIKDLICTILRERLPNIDAIYDKSSDSLDQKYQTNYSIENTYLFRKRINRSPAKENNNSFSINWD